MAQTDKTGRAGEHYVAAELNRRGAYASPFSGNVPGIDIVATDGRQEGMACIQVKTKRFANQRWPVSLRHGWKDIPTDVSCLCLNTCDPGRCAEASVKVSPHRHHDDATSLYDLDEVEGKNGHFWVFVSLEEELQYWIVPDDVVRDGIRKRFIKYLEERGGHRPGSSHHSLVASVFEVDLAPWQSRWDKLGLGLDGPEGDLEPGVDEPESEEL
jgi:hypothetical protein